MRHFFWLLFLAGFVDCDTLLNISPNSFVAWKGSCLLIPCQISETLYSAEVRVTGLLWLFEPFWDKKWFDFNGDVLYNSSKTLEENASTMRPAFRGRVTFVGDLQKRDCSLMMTDLRVNDSGTYGARGVATVENYSWRQKHFLNITVNVLDSAPAPQMETVIVKKPERLTMNVSCSMTYHCPDEPIILTLTGLDKPRLSSQKMTIENTIIRTMVSFEATWEDDGKWLVCLATDPNASELSRNAVQLDPEFRPKLVQIIVENDLPIKEGDTIMLNCSAAKSNPTDTWYNWFKLDPHTVEYSYSASKLLVFPAIPELELSYECEVCNYIGCTSSPRVSIDVHFAPREVKIQKQPSGKIAAGKPVKLTCGVQRAKPWDLSYTWYKDGQRLERDSVSEQLIIPEFAFGHAGKYWCEASNSVGTSRSSTVVLHVSGGSTFVENALSISPNSLFAWKGSCVVIPCHVSKTFNSANVRAIAVGWYFEPFWDDNGHDYNGSLLYDSFNAIATSPAFQGRVRFEGNLQDGDCSVMINELQMNDSGTYGARVIASVANYPWRLKWFQRATVNITESPPEIKIETVPVEIKEWRITTVACSMPYHCPDTVIHLTLHGLNMSSQITTTKNRSIQTMMMFEPTWEDDGKMLRCLLRNREGSELSQSTMKLKVGYTAEDVQLTIVNNLPIKEGDTTVLRCSAGRCPSGAIWYNWIKSDSRTVEYTYSVTDSWSFPATSVPEHSMTYKCEVCNTIGCTSSQNVTVDVHFTPKDVQISRTPEGRIHEYSQVMLECLVGAANPPQIKYTWYKNGQLLQKNFADHWLSIHMMTSGTSDSYHCQASNSVGTSRSQEVILNVHY